MSQGGSGRQHRRAPLLLLVATIAGALALQLGTGLAAAAPTVRASLTWDNGSDLDLHAWDTQSHHSFYSCESVAGGCSSAVPNSTYDGDNTTGFQPDPLDCGPAPDCTPETFTDEEDPSTRTFIFGICDYSDINDNNSRQASASGTGPSTNWTLVVTDPGGSQRTFNGSFSPGTDPASGQGLYVAVSPDDASWDLSQGNPCEGDPPQQVNTNQPPACTDTHEVVASGGGAIVGPDCTDPEHDPLTYAPYPQYPQHGSFNQTASDGTGTYSSTAPYTGPDNVVWGVQDGQGNAVYAVSDIDVRASTNTPPNAGSTGNVKLLSGNVLIKLPGASSFDDLDHGVQIPEGSLIDTSDGEVRLRTDTSGSSATTSGQGGGTQFADFHAGLFKFTQQPNDPLVTLLLRGPFDCPFRKTWDAASKGEPSTANVSRRRRRRLWGRGRGRHRTRGHHGSASARGTEWLTEDESCDSGTFFKVLEGTIQINDYGNKIFSLTAPGTYHSQSP